MTRFDEEPDAPVHGECAAETASLRASLAASQVEVERLRAERDARELSRDNWRAMCLAGTEPCVCGGAVFVCLSCGRQQAEVGPERESRLQGEAGARAGALTFAEFGRANQERCEATSGYHTGVKEYGAATWALCLAEEAGEVMGAVLGATGQKKRKAHLTAKDVGDELADLVAYADLLAHAMGLDLGACVAAKWNRVSERIGYPGRLASSTSTAPTSTVYADSKPPVTDETRTCCGCGDPSAPWEGWQRPDAGKCWWTWDAPSQEWLFACKDDCEGEPAKGENDGR